MFSPEHKALLRAGGLLLRLLRMSSGIEQERMAARLGVSQPTVSRWEKGRGGPDGKELTSWLMLCQVAGRPRNGEAEGPEAALLETSAPAPLSEARLNNAMRALFALYAPEQAVNMLTPPQPELMTEIRRLTHELLLGQSGIEAVEPASTGGGLTLLERAPLGAPSLVPLYADVAAGLGEEQEARDGAREALEVPRGILAADPQAYALRVRGDSMAPLLLEGDAVVVSPALGPEDGCLVAAYVEPDGDVVKRFRWADRSAHAAYNQALTASESGEGPQVSYVTPEALLHPENPAYPVIRIGGELGRPARIWGRVVLQLREL